MKKGKLKGWEGFGPNRGEFVKAEYGFLYICEKVGIVETDPAAPEAAEFREMLIDWYFSGNWVEVYEDG